VAHFGWNHWLTISGICTKRIYQNHEEAKSILASNIEVYNNRRPHASLNYLTPSAAHEMTGDFIKQWKHYPYLKRTEPVN
jgi:hypothetical protein